MMTTAIKDMHASPREAKDMILGECLSRYGAKACESFVRRDRDERARRDISRKAVHVVGSHQVGGIVSTLQKKHEQARTRIETEWADQGLIGFEKDKKNRPQQNATT